MKFFATIIEQTERTYCVELECDSQLSAAAKAATLGPEDVKNLEPHSSVNYVYCEAVSCDTPEEDVELLQLIKPIKVNKSAYRKLIPEVDAAGKVLDKYNVQYYLDEDKNGIPVDTTKTFKTTVAKLFDNLLGTSGDSIYMDSGKWVKLRRPNALWNEVLPTLLVPAPPITPKESDT